METALPLPDRRTRLAQPMDRDHRECPPEALQGLIDLLSAPGEVNLDAITVALQTLDVSAEALGAAVFEDASAYVRTLLYQDERVELLALTWLPGQRSPLHEHVASSCIVRVVSGVATENLYRRREFGAIKREHMSRTLRPGIVSRAPGGTLHSLGNDAPPDGETLVTLHVYAAPSHAHG